MDMNYINRNMPDLNKWNREELICITHTFYIAYSDIAAVSNKLDNIRWQIADENRRMEKIPERMSAGDIVRWSFASAGIAMGIYGLLIILKCYKWLSLHGLREPIDASVPVWVLLTIFLICIFYNVVIRNIRIRRKHKKALEQHNERMRYLDSQEQFMKKEKQKAYQEWYEILSREYIIPERYRNKYSLYSIYKYLTECRASNWKEAVELYEKELIESRRMGHIRIR